MRRANSQPVALAAEFPAADIAEWRRRAAAAVQRTGGAPAADPVEALSHPTYDGVQIRPLYTGADALHWPAPGQAPFVRGGTADGAPTTGWDVRSRLADRSADRLRAAARTELAQGATSLWLVVGPDGIPAADLPSALDGIAPHRALIVLDAGPETRLAAEGFLRLVDDSGGRGEGVAGGLGVDPIGARARTGCDADLTLVPDLARAAARFPRLIPITVDASVYHDAGAGDADEIAIATAVGVAYLRALTEAGQDVDSALRQLEFRFAVTADQFVSIAKLRAARRVWDRVAELSGAAADRRSQRQHAVTSAAMMTRRDPWVNMLRTTIACFAAAVAGAAAVTVQSFDSAIGIPDDFGRRIARNTSPILHDEASLARVTDPAGGSWYVERLTDALAERAWDGFTELERAGGALAALDGGVVAARIGRASQQRADDIASRRAPVTGVSDFALLTETPVLRPPALARPPGPLPPHRYAEPFERLRDRADAALSERGRRPSVLLLALGPRSAAASRLGFAASLFRAGGIEPVVRLQLAEDAGEYAVVCLCGTDEDYDRCASETARAARATGVRWVWQAGRTQHEDVDGTVFAGCDALAVLERTLDLLDVP